MPMSFIVRRAWLAALIVGLLAVPASAPAATRSQLPCLPGVTCPKPKPRCTHADVQPSSGNLAEVRGATLCLLNVQRRKHKLSALRTNRPLRGVASRYARQMVTLAFFSHVSPTGQTFVERIKQWSHYLDGANGYQIGENIAWGGGILSTPRRIVSAWMNSAGHRANILNGAYRDIGVGIALGVPVVGGGSGATYVNEFGHRG